ncbi:Cell differentiation protein RCD1 [Carex littledalei]|uniref:Cell differentiation protein RCD1 n=1 Tax=Carex littledalei TaxID=544730 RepID=A0A833QPP8_9POAL|nr:Cell differentiation protein RCD1 [Carex littledalei]
MLPGAGRFVPPESREGRASNLRVTALPYCRISQPREVPLNQLLEDVLDPQKRGPALIHLAMKRNTVPNFSLIVWQTPVIVTLILQPIVIDDRVRDEFFRAEIPQYLYPLVTNPRQSASFEKLRITSLGMIGFLVKELDLEAVQFLLRSEVVPLCLRCMEVGTVLSKTVAVFILEKLLSTEIGLEYICENQERFLATNQMLASMFTTLPHVRSSLRLLRRVIICFYLFSCNPRKEDSLAFYNSTYKTHLFSDSVSEITLYNLLPDGIRDGSCIYMFQDDTEIQNCVYQLLWNLGCIYNNNNNNGINSY